MNVYELDGVTRCPSSCPDDPDQPVWALYRCYLRTRDGDDEFLDAIKDCLTVQEALDLAAKLGYGWPRGV